MLLTSIPSPSQNIWYIGFLPIRAYALLIIIGIFVAAYIADRRYQKMGGHKEVVFDVLVWAVLFGIVGARIYHVLTTAHIYFGADANPMQIFKIWEGGIGILGAISGGALGIFLALRRRGLRFGPMADAIAPGLLIAQAIGRLGNYFNQELYGLPADLPWALEIDAEHLAPGYVVGTTFHPTFLYEILWNLTAFWILLRIARKWKLGGGQVALVYLLLYSFGRFWIEMIRIDTSLEFLGLRTNSWAALFIFLGAGFALQRYSRYLAEHPEQREIFLPGGEQKFQQFYGEVAVLDEAVAVKESVDTKETAQVADAVDTAEVVGNREDEAKAETVFLSPTPERNESKSDIAGSES